MDLYKQEDKGLQSAHVYESLGGYAPTIGILGAVLGLMQVLGTLDDPALIGPGIATAFVATIYGVGSANFNLFTYGAKIKAHSAKRIFISRVNYRRSGRHC